MRRRIFGVGCGLLAFAAASTFLATGCDDDEMGGILAERAAFVMWPEEGEVLETGFFGYNIVWVGVYTDWVWIEYSPDGGQNWFMIQPPPGGGWPAWNDGWYNWDVPFAVSDDYMLRVIPDNFDYDREARSARFSVHSP